MSFHSDLIQEQNELIDRETRWMRLEGRAFGSDSSYPLKVHLAINNSEWEAAYSEGLEQYAQGFNIRKRRKFNQQCSNVATMPREALIKASRNAISKSECLVELGWSGPVFPTEKDLQDWIDGSAELALSNGEKVEPPADAMVFFEMSNDGSWRVPDESDIPDDWKAKPEQVREMLTYDAFVIQIGNLRRIFEDEGSEDEAEDLGNLPSGLSLQPRGVGSQKAKGKGSKN